MKNKTLELVHCDTIPKELEIGKLYVSKKYQTTNHICPCGKENCGIEVPLPIYDKDNNNIYGKEGGWEYTETAGKATIYPSIGNYSYPCESHYWIRNNKVIMI